MKYRLCAFADEADPMLTGQMEAMQRNGISLLEIRGVDRENISALTPAKVQDVAHRLSENGLAVWSIGSPTGKIKLTDDWQAHMDSFRGMLDAAATFGAGAFRMFSFYEAQNEKNEVIDRLGRLLDLSRGSGITLACGTGSCASLVAANINGLCERKATIVLDGGELVDEWDEETNHVFMTGPATDVFDGEYTLIK